MYAELVCRSNFSFLQGASHPDELVRMAACTQMAALAVTDQDGLYAAVKAHGAAKGCGVKYILGSRLSLPDLADVVVYAQNRAGYQNLCRLISESRLLHPKGQSGLPWQKLAERAEGLIALLPDPAPLLAVAPLAEAFAGRFYVGIHREFSAEDERRLHEAQALSRTLKAPLCAHNDVHMHSRTRKRLLDVLNAIRLKTTVDKVGRKLFPNAEKCLKGPSEMAQLFSDLPEAVERTLEIAGGCHFSLRELRYHFPDEHLPSGHTPDSYLRHLVTQGLLQRYGTNVSEAVRRQIEHELNLIRALEFQGYFLAIWDIVHFAKGRGILCQGRGSAANSAVCYALGITSIDPVRMGLLFERFLSMERNEPPDIDVDFEHERREEVLQYVYQKHGRHRAGMVCEVVTYRGRLAAREVGKALGLSLDQVDRLAKGVDAAGESGLTSEWLREAGLSAQDERVQRAVELISELEGFPRHLSIHVGGFVMTQEPLSDLVPLENATMEGRTVVQWEKDDLNETGILKVDLLGLGMLTALSKCFALIAEDEGKQLSLANLPAEDPAVYDMLCEADAIGVFQVESRAQMNMLPRLRPRKFYDLVVEIAIIRPGPILGDMVHPYLRRRDGDEPVSYPSPEVEGILEKTLGVPLFQEQAMKLAMVAAGFSAAEADQLRRILSHKRAEELLLPYERRFIEGCVARGYPREFAQRCFQQFRGFSHYGFPESHSASFALICYASAYLKKHHPAAFCAALINSQPMGFYAPHTLVEDAKRHGVRVLPVDATISRWDCTLEKRALRLGLRLVKGLRQKTAAQIEKCRGQGQRNLEDWTRRVRIPRCELARLALAGALSPFGGRREVLWKIQAMGSFDEEDLFCGMPMDDVQVALPPMTAAERIFTDYDTTSLSLEQHPLGLLRPQLSKMGAKSAAQLAFAKSGQKISVGGMVICRQRPPTAKGFCFLSLEDETGIANAVVPPHLFECFRRDIVEALFLCAHGVIERSSKVVNVKVHHLERLSAFATAQVKGSGLMDVSAPSMVPTT